MPRVVILAGEEYRSMSDWVTAGTTKAEACIRNWDSSLASIIQLGVVSRAIYLPYSAYDKLNDVDKDFF